MLSLLTKLYWVHLYSWDKALLPNKTPRDRLIARRVLVNLTMYPESGVE